MCSLFSYQLLISFRNTSVFFLLIFFQLFCPKWDFSHGKFGWLSPGKASCDRVKLPYLRCILGVLEFHNPPKSEMDYMIFNVDTDVNACDCTRGCTDTGKESAPRVVSGRKIPCRTWKSNLRQRCDCPTLCQLNYIPTSLAQIKPTSTDRHSYITKTCKCLESSMRQSSLTVVKTLPAAGKCDSPLCQLYNILPQHSTTTVLSDSCTDYFPQQGTDTIPPGSCTDFSHEREPQQSFLTAVETLVTS